ncbi:hypothetical protein B0H14DRAFT_3520130 [Mycena olivaceomarginata]|nr:hypothetical protein B0H14DRAFT_3520130 [Mycena olivaceomarginata]
MAEGGRRDASTTRPGDIVNQAKQKRRTKDEIEADKRAVALAKEEKLAEAATKNRQGVKRAAAAVQELTQQDELARATAARPDLVTAEWLLKESMELTRDQRPLCHGCRGKGGKRGLRN